MRGKKNIERYFFASLFFTGFLNLSCKINTKRFVEKNAE